MAGDYPLLTEQKKVSGLFVIFFGSNSLQFGSATISLKCRYEYIANPAKRFRWHPACLAK